MAKRLIMFNGPPSAGKDTGADFVAAHYHGMPLKVSAPIKAALRAMFDWDANKADAIEQLKETPLDELFGVTYRDAQIAFSEVYAKSTFGINVFGQLAARRIRDCASNIIVTSDTGFEPEAEAMVKVVGNHNALLLRVHRKGCGFKKDSRSYISLPDVATIDLYNNGSVQDYRDNIRGVVNQWLSL